MMAAVIESSETLGVAGRSVGSRRRRLKLIDCAIEPDDNERTAAVFKDAQLAAKGSEVVSLWIVA